MTRNVIAPCVSLMRSREYVGGPSVPPAVQGTGATDMKLAIERNCMLDSDLAVPMRMDPMPREATIPVFALVDAVILEGSGRKMRVDIPSTTRSGGCTGA